MVFSTNMLHSIKNTFHSFLPIHISNNIPKYLGLPTHIGRSKSQVFRFLVDRIRTKLKGWKKRNLSFSGRGVVIRAVIQSMPTYVMSCFRIPLNVCDRIERAICRFWWGGNEEGTWNSSLIENTLPIRIGQVSVLDTIGYRYVIHFEVSEGLAISYDFTDWLRNMILNSDEDKLKGHSIYKSRRHNSDNERLQNVW